jgi:hypothetical protein
LHKKEEEGGDNVAVVAFFRFVALQRNVAFFAMLRCNAAPQTSKQNK